MIGWAPVSYTHLPDSLGPRVVESVYVTRHIKQYMPEALPGPVRAVSAVAPGVLGVTGVETMELVRGVVEHCKPDLVIAVDSLASRRAARISTTVQLTDTGISPGAGVGNNRTGIDRETLGVPVIAIGVPLVVFAATISQDTISLIADETGLHGDEERLKELAAKVIAEHIGELIVTPKAVSYTQLRNICCGKWSSAKNNKHDQNWKTGNGNANAKM